MLRLTLLLALVAHATAYTEVGLGNFMFKTIDPIHLPGQFASHLHTFFGSDAVTAKTSTSAELRGGCTTATNPNDLSTYWIPTLLFTGGKTNENIAPERFSAYYDELNTAEIPFPENSILRAGNATATSQADTNPFANINWLCEGDPGEPGKDPAAFPTTTCSTHLQHLIYFADCADPADPTSFAYSGVQNWKGDFKPENRCPEGMKRIPKLRFSIRYDLRKLIPQGWNGPPPLTLSSGNSFSAHGDFFFGWDAEAATNMLKAGPQGDFNLVDGSKGPGGSGPPNCHAQDQDLGDHAKMRRMERKWVS